MNELVFEVTQEADGSFVAECLVDQGARHRGAVGIIQCQRLS